MVDEKKPWTVTQTVEHAKVILEEDPNLGRLMVMGEVSNFSGSPNGHWYFDLKDERSTLRVAMFRGSNLRVKFKVKDGMKVVVAGKISVYPQRGAMQMIAGSMQVVGEGDILKRLQELAKKLEKEGLFDVKKATLPRFPTSIAVVTSKKGAALRDVIKVITKRAPHIDILVCPATVQGVSAPESIINALALADRSRADVIIMGRGGGSIEDLLCFSDENLLRAIASTKKPVISAVGHQTDTMLSDYVADVRAATPTEGAELATSENWKLMQEIDGLVDSLMINLRNRISTMQMSLDSLWDARVFRKGIQKIDNFQSVIENQTELAKRSVNQFITNRKSVVEGTHATLERLDPNNVIERGFSVVQDSQGKIINSIKAVESGDEIVSMFVDGEIHSKVTKKEAKNE